jgi:hypothetical protein
VIGTTKRWPTPLSAFAFPLFSLTSCVAGVTSDLLLSFQSGLLFYSLSIFRLACIVLSLQGCRLCSNLGSFRGGAFSSLPSFRSRLGGLPLGDTGVASHYDRLPRCPALGRSGTVGGGSRFRGALQETLFRIGRSTQTIGEVGVS